MNTPFQVYTANGRKIELNQHIETQIELTNLNHRTIEKLYIFPDLHVDVVLGNEYHLKTM